jgi:hypothetical protein
VATGNFTFCPPPPPYSNKEEGGVVSYTHPYACLPLLFCPFSTSSFGRKTISTKNGIQNSVERIVRFNSYCLTPLDRLETGVDKAYMLEQPQPFPVPWVGVCSYSPIIAVVALVIVVSILVINPSLIFLPYLPHLSLGLLAC